MRVRYDKLWRLMKDNRIKKSELAKSAEISSYTMTKLNRDLPVNMEVMINLCKIFHCDIGDLMEVIDEDYNGLLTSDIQLFFISSMLSEQGDLDEYKSKTSPFLCG